MKARGYFITLTKPNGGEIKHFVTRLGEVMVFLSVHFWTSAIIRPLPDKELQNERSGKKCRPVVCVETGERFESVLDASKHFGLPYKAVWNCLRSGTSRKGLHFKDAKPEKEDEGSAS